MMMLHRTFQLQTLLRATTAAIPPTLKPGTQAATIQHFLRFPNRAIFLLTIIHLHAHRFTPLHQHFAANGTTIMGARLKGFFRFIHMVFSFQRRSAPRSS